MKLHPKIRAELMHRAGNDARAAQMWRAYIAFLEVCPALPEHTPGTAVHHILWRAEYPKFIKAKWNLIRLQHADHTAAAALALGAEPDNGGLRTGFDATYRLAGTSRAWTPNIQRISHLYLAKEWSTERLGKRYGVSLQTICNFLHRNGIKVRHAWDIALWRPKNPIAVIHLYQNGGWTPKRIGEKYKVSGARVSALLRRHKIKMRSHREGKTWKPLKSAEVIHLYRRGWSLRRVGEKFSVSKPTVRAFLLRYKIKIRKRTK